jgi:hypothetical protein
MPGTNRDVSILDAYRSTKQEKEEQERALSLYDNYSPLLLIFAIVIILFVRIAILS